MDLKLFINTMLICFPMWQGLVHSDPSECLGAKASSCGECIRIGKDCGWCTKDDFLQPGELTSARCDDIEALKSRGCTMENIENPKGSWRLDINKPLTARVMIESEDIIQIAPQKLTLNLRSGEPQTFSLYIKRAEDHPIDLYFLVDLSFSSENDLENMKMLGIALKKEMRKITSDVRIGFGTTEETPCPAGKKCTGQSRFRNVLPLTNDMAEFDRSVRKLAISAGLNSSSRAVDGIMQAAVCGDIIGWRHATRLLVFYSNTELHFAGNNTRGRRLPSDGNCQLDTQGVYISGHHQRYPSITRLARKLNDNKIQLLFVVKEEFKDAYKALQVYIQKSEVGLQTSNSRNATGLIDVYQALASKVILDNSKLPKGVSMHYTAYCKNNINQTGEHGKKCSGIQVGEEVRFTISITAKTCPDNGRTAAIEIKPLGFHTNVEITLKFACDCDCEKHRNRMMNSPLCTHGNGLLVCGACRCSEGYFGESCERRADEINIEDADASCRHDNTSLICSDNGDCVCGECVCRRRDNPDERIFGKYCECDNFSCYRSDGLLCGGNGACDCGVCRCSPGFTGNACDCSLDVSSCVSANGMLCNGQGVCKCGKCTCTGPKFQGLTCEQCPTCEGVCSIHRYCVQCKTFNSGPKKDTCDQCKFEVSLVERKVLMSQPICAFWDADNGLFYFSYFVNDQNIPMVNVFLP
ncbi:integrin beta-1-like [Leucoraja erinacea]|uniref:integrin beta-1-like n=1 Tax=Leucoraja erinaceus TaxID=7782 RepID=UPI002457A09B|nr:integrin beta-1-like [Leucoraja erinacea]XP_055521143.1 integrin beta-1-like [Leucoraja erinacea]